MRVLVVENNPDLSKISRLFFNQSYGFETDCALNVESALSMAKDNDYECILTEFRLPRQGMGLKLARMLRDNEFKGLIIALVSQPEAFSVEKMLEAGFNACLPKPLNREDLDYLKLDPETYRFDGDDLVFDDKNTPKQGKLEL